MSVHIENCDFSAVGSNNGSSPNHNNINGGFMFDLSFADIPTCIEKNLYLGSLKAATDIILLKEFSIKVILTVNSEPIKTHEEGIDYFFVKSENEPSENMLTNFDRCADLMASCVTNDCPILVHCNYSFSISSTVIVAYLMRKHRMASDSALIYVRGRCPLILPNYGFINQLIIYERMGYQIDYFNHDYRFFMFSYFVNQCRMDLSSSDEIAKYMVDFLDHFRNEAAGSDSSKQIAPPNQVYRCAACYVPLYFEYQVIQGPDWTSPNRVLVSEECSSIFIEPVAWMLRKQRTNLINSCILCPCCQEFIGHYYFSGIVCEIVSKGNYCLKHPTQSCCVFLILNDKVISPEDDDDTTQSG